MGRESRILRQETPDGWEPTPEQMSIGDLLTQLKSAASVLNVVNPYRELMKLAVVAIRGLAKQLTDAQAQLAAQQVPSMAMSTSASGCPTCGGVHSDGSVCAAAFEPAGDGYGHGV